MATATNPNAAPEWHVVDAEGKTLGRVSSEISTLLMGKHKPTYVPYLHSGDFVVVVNAEKVAVTGRKLEQKKYYRYSGYHGGLREQNLGIAVGEKTRRSHHPCRQGNASQEQTRKADDPSPQGIRRLGSPPPSTDKTQAASRP